MVQIIYGCEYLCGNQKIRLNTIQIRVNGRVKKKLLRQDGSVQ